MRGVSIRTILGVLALFVGLAAIFVPDLAALLPFAPTLIDALGALLIVVGLWVAQSVFRTTGTSPDPPVPETRADLPAPGDDFDDLLAKRDQLSSLSRTYEEWIETDDEVRGRLQRIALTLLQERYSMGERAAAVALEDGTWTDDPEASAYFAGETGEAVATDVQLGDFVPLDRFSRSTRAERVVAELDEIARGEREQARPGADTETPARESRETTVSGEDAVEKNQRAATQPTDE